MSYSLIVDTVCGTAHSGQGRAVVARGEANPLRRGPFFEIIECEGKNPGRAVIRMCMRRVEADSKSDRGRIARNVTTIEA